MGPGVSVDLQVKYFLAGCPCDGDCPTGPGVWLLTPGQGQGWMGHPSPTSKVWHVWEDVYASGIALRVAKLFLHGTIVSLQRTSRERFLHAEVVSVPDPFCCWQQCVCCSHIICLQILITLTKSKEEMYLLYFAFRSLCPGKQHHF